MAKSEHAEFDVGHPAPDRAQVSLGLLMFGIFGAPAAWMLQLVAGASIGGLVCLGPHGTALATARADWANPAMIAINLAALLIAAVALAASFRTLHQTGSGYAEGHDSVMEAGEGRSRYMAIWGVWTSLLFIFAIAFNTIAVFWSGLCGL